MFIRHEDAWFFTVSRSPHSWMPVCLNRTASQSVIGGGRSSCEPRKQQLFNFMRA